MKTAGKELDKNQLNEAHAEQKAAADELQKMVKGFTERREDDLDRLAKKLAEKQKELESLSNEQDELQKRIKSAEKAGDKDEFGAARQEAKAAGEKGEGLGGTADAPGRRSGRTRAAAQAGEAMDQDAARLEKGQKPEDEDAALDRLADAHDEVDQAKEDTEDQLSREQQARIAEEVQRLKERQEGLSEEAVRIRDGLKTNGGRSRMLRISLGGLSVAQKGLSDETEALAHKDLAGRQCSSG